MKPKKLIVEFDVNDEVNFEELAKAIDDNFIEARKNIDERLGRMNNGSTAGLFNVTLRYLGFDGVNRHCKNGYWTMTKINKKSKK